MGLFIKSREKKEAEFMAPQYLKHLNDSIKLVNNTNNPDTFFYRYSFMLETINKLIKIQKYVKFKGDKPCDLLKQVNNKKVDTINDFIDRYYESIVSQINKLKTDKAKQKRIDSFYDSLSPYFYKMDKINIDKVNKLNEELINKSITLSSNNNSTAIEKRDNEINIDKMPWYIMVSFGESTSKSYEKAVYLAKNSPKYEKLVNEKGNITHTATYSSSKKDFLNFIILYDVVSKWKSTFFVINGEMVDKKTVGKIKYCYGDKCQSVKSKFCYGASFMTENPFGCHRLQISSYNNPWWKYYEAKGNHYELNREALLERINLAADTFKYCPSFDIENITNVAMSLPAILKKKEYEKIGTQQSNVHISNF